jgi:hypothetical protein
MIIIDDIKNSNVFNKFASILLLVAIFILLMYMGTSLLIYFNSPKKNPYIIKGLVPGNKRITIYQNPKIKNSKTIIRSVNEDGGLEFTWCIWLYVNSGSDDDSEYNTEKYKHIFHKGNLSKVNENGIFVPNNAPGLYFKYNNHNDTNEDGDKSLSLYLFINTYNKIIESLKVNEIPIEKWFHIAFRIKQKTLDLFFNGEIVKRKIFSSLPKQNYDDIHIGQKGGFNGTISELRYFGSALSGSEILSIVKNGPDLRSLDKKRMMDYYPPYFSINWFLKN